MCNKKKARVRRERGGGGIQGRAGSRSPGTRDVLRNRGGQ